MRICRRAWAILAALAIAGCGEESGSERFDGDARDVASAVERLRDAAADGDGQRICRELLAADARSRLGRACPDRMDSALRALDDTSLEVAGVRLEGDQAIATVVTGKGDPPRSGDLRLVREGGEWRLARVGPLPPISR